MEPEPEPEHSGSREAHSIAGVGYNGHQLFGTPWVPRVSLSELAENASQLASALERWSFVVLTDVPAGDLATAAQLAKAFQSLFDAPKQLKDAIAPYNTDEMPREFGYLDLDLKEQWFGTKHNSEGSVAGEGDDQGWPMASLPEFRADVLAGMGLYDRICRDVLRQVAPDALEACDATPPSHAHSGILDAFAYFNAPKHTGTPDTFKNCGEHTDPGYFTISPRAPVRGLQLHVRLPPDCDGGSSRSHVGC
jgi:isopenicillin N synthase-like dioxygenase